MYPKVCTMYDQNPYRIMEVARRSRNGKSRSRFLFIGVNAMMALAVSVWSYMI